MPTVQVLRDPLLKALGKQYTDDEFDDLCFRYGIELDEVNKNTYVMYNIKTSERKIIEKETGVVDKNASDEVLYKIDVPANRYDLLCMEGLARALKVYGQQTPIPKYSITAKPAVYQKMIVTPEVKAIRPIVVCGILRDITFDQQTYKNFIDLQEKLHQNICKKRSLVSIGTHDLDTVKGPFYYKALKPEDIKFVPLSQTKEFNAVELFKFYDETSSHLKKYLHIIKDSPVYPVIYDSNNTLLSLPPIINGDHSKITLNTKNVFIEVTATDYTKANIVLNIMLTMFSEYCKLPFTMEQVEVVDVDGTTKLFPQIDEVEIKASTSYINKCIGVQLEPTNMIEMLKRMSLDSQLSQDKQTITVSVPSTRSDIIHECDIMEDVAIGYGFNNIPRVVPNTPTTGRIQPINKLSELLAAEVAQAGFTEIMTFVLCSNKDNYSLINRDDDNNSVKIANYLHEDFSEIRTSLTNTLLKSVVSNKALPLPLKLFEVGDISIKGSTGNKNLADPNNNNSDTGSYNKRMLGAIYCNHSARIEVVHGILDKLMLSLNIKHISDKTASAYGKKYQLKPNNDKLFMTGMGADILVDDKKIGVLGVVHPTVLKNYGISYPCSLLEFEVNMELASCIQYPIQKK
ncbi:phenylalanine-tRNA ligase [Heterostelium album PN500]|uniref:phenylalanine--tRNA ligase n=1 Tax=Heterostelium pallidum (strain ATCC 26659 / Pp 5 / PN500) TaxID=670386 RepID=D3BMN8_HETP5|nr:phenylalanine-tRNA ligase [Heterostelium album PN500]EFA77250.1 phenylalanine-tRNA ligase [Heterostelium album PN500]|eukprot:XP_020429379.1 phenylalanine-tRNA ligase [Heterostelium album PN500]